MNVVMFYRNTVTSGVVGKGSLRIQTQSGKEKIERK
jgi:hypothetical protein